MVLAGSDIGLEVLDIGVRVWTEERGYRNAGLVGYRWKLG